MDISNINWKNKDDVIKAVRENGCYLAYASNELKRDKEVALEAIGTNSDAIREIDESLLSDKEFMLKVVERSNNSKNYRLDANPLIYASEELKQDKEFVLEVIKSRGVALQYADYFKDDKDVVIEAVKSNGFALEYADEKLRGDKEIVLEAVKKSGYALMNTTPELKNDKEVVFTALKQIRNELDLAIENGEVSEENRDFEFNDIGEQLLNDEEFMLEAQMIMHGSIEEKKHTVDEIIAGINPKKSDIDDIAREMIEEQTLNKQSKHIDIQ